MSNELSGFVTHVYKATSPATDPRTMNAICTQLSPFLTVKASEVRTGYDLGKRSGKYLYGVVNPLNYKKRTRRE